MRREQRMVAAFHRRHGHPVAPRPTLAVSRADRRLRVRLMREELAEIERALARRDLVALADGLADLTYVVLGTAVTYGIPLATAFAEVHRSNMTKAAAPRHKRLGAKYAHGVDPKGPSYRPPDLARVLRVALSKK